MSNLLPGQVGQGPILRPTPCLMMLSAILLSKLMILLSVPSATELLIYRNNES